MKSQTKLITAMNYGIRAASFKTRAGSYELRYTVRYKIAAPADDSTVPYPEHGMMKRCRSTSHIDRIQLYWLITGIRHLRWLMVVRYRCCTIQSSAGENEISKLIVQSLSFAKFWKLNWQVQFNFC
jgi:hypothetical protein